MNTRLTTLALSIAMAITGQEIGFSERYVLAADRRVPLQELIPGSEDYYAWNVLALQTQGTLSEAEAILARYGERYPQSGRREVLLNRQRLLAYGQDRDAALAHLRRVLGLTFDHQREVLPEEQKLPSRLAPDLVSRAALLATALQEPGLNGFAVDCEQTHALLLESELAPDRRRALLGHVAWPDSGRLAPLVIADLKHPGSGGFGSLKVHGVLLLPQLDQCAEAIPDLLGNAAFVQAYLGRLQPAGVLDWENSPAEQEAYLDRLWAFARRLPPVQNSVRAHVLYHRLTFDRGQGIHDKARFLEYAQLPRQVPYINRAYVQRTSAAGVPYADLAADLGASTRLPPVGADEALVRDYLEHFLRDADSSAEFSPWFEEGYLTAAFAETKLLYGVGNADAWFGMLDPVRVKELRERVEVNFAADNPRWFAVDQPVRLRLALKNVPQLLVKTHEINTVNWYLQKQDEITQSVDLDGLVPGEERQITYAHPPLHRHTESFEFPALDRPGVWVVEFIGNGKSSRALVRKGRLRLAERLGAAGHVFRVYDQDGKAVPDAIMHVGGQAYRPDHEGAIGVPFSTAPGPLNAVVRQGDFATLHRFEHRSEDYTLSARFFLDPEAIQTGNRARVLVRAALSVQGVPVDLDLLEEVTLVIRTTDVLGVSSARPWSGVKLLPDKDHVAEFLVPPDLRQVEVTLAGKVTQVSTGRKIDLSVSRVFPANTAEATAALAALWLRRASDGYWLELVGKGGDPVPRSAVSVRLQPRLFRRPIEVVLVTDDTGRVGLGPLTEIEAVHAESPLAGNTVDVTLEPLLSRAAWPTVVTLADGEPLILPTDGLTEPDTGVGLIAQGGSGALSYPVAPEVASRDGLLVIAGLPTGEYAARLQPSCRRVHVTVLPGKRTGLDILARERCESGLPYCPLAIAECSLAGEVLSVRLANAGPGTRVHVVAGRLRIAGDPTDSLMLGLGWPSWTHLDPQGPARYVSGRDLGDEARYVFERRYAAAFPGVMLQRPSLLLNPWETRRTETERQLERAGESWAEAADAERKAADKSRVPARGLAVAASEPAGMPPVPALEMLAAPALALCNLRPDAAGRLSVDLPALGPRQVLAIIATDGRETVRRQLLLACPAETYRDLRHVSSLDGAARFGELRTVSTQAAAAEIVVGNASAARLQSYASVADVYALFESLSNSPELAEFRFILDWPDLPAERRQELYSRYACHELNVFLSRKDPGFFSAVVTPYLANRRDKTVVDLWLLGGDLTPFLEPWQWARLNAFEQVAVAKALPAQAAAVRRALTEVCTLRPQDPQADLELFLKALFGRGEAAGFDMVAFNAAAGQYAAGDLGGAFSGFGAGAGKPAAPPPAPAMPAAAAAPRVLAEAEATEQQVADGKAERGRQAGVELRRLADADRARRRDVRRLYVALDKTAEWAEANYWKLPLPAQDPERVPQNRFWADWAAHDGKGPFLSTHVAEATASFSEMMLALAVLDLPCRAPTAEPTMDGTTLRLTTPGPTICYRRELRALDAGPMQEVFVRQEFTDPNAEPERTPYGERPRRIGEVFPANRAIDGAVMVTNATPEPRHVDVLVQVPEGAVPLADALRLRSIPVLLQPYEQTSVQVTFFFPRPGTYRHCPATISAEGKIVAQAAARSFTITAAPQTDTGTWDYVSQFGTDDDVLGFLARCNLRELLPHLDRIAFRLRERGFYTQVLEFLRRQHAFVPVLWSYSVYHADEAALAEYLPHTPLADACGPWLESPVLRVDSIRRGSYEHKEYWPLVNARAHVLGDRRRILNAPFLAQYQAFLERLCHKGVLDAEDRLALTVYLASQDRLEEALAQFGQVAAEAVVERVQYDAAQAYLRFCQGQWEDARQIARRYAEYPVKRWRERFAEILAQCEELAGEESRVVDPENRTQVQTHLADAEAVLDMTVENRRISIRHRNVTEIMVSYYPVDVELLFSRAPFAKDASAAYAVVRPSRSDRHSTDVKGGEFAVDLPSAYANRNVVIEATAAGLQRSQAYTPHSLDVHIQENYGQLRVLHAVSGKPLTTVYVKVYARYQDGRVAFYKDGYTDLRGRFDYTSLSTDDLPRVERFAVLVLSSDAGAVVREIPPPKR